MKQSVNVLKLQGLISHYYKSYPWGRDSLLKLDRLLHHVDVQRIFPKLKTVTFNIKSGMLYVVSEVDINMDMVLGAIESSGISIYAIKSKNHNVCRL